MKLQNHIHLATDLDIGAEKSPIYRWQTSNISSRHIFNIAIDDTLNGKTLARVAPRFQGSEAYFTPLRYKEWNVELVLRPSYGFTLDQRINQFETLIGKWLYFVPHLHADDGEDHTNQVVSVVIRDVGQMEPVNTQHTYFRVQLKMREGERYAFGE
jgi:hypothetical protein